MDRLEEYIRKNRENMDIYSPSSGLWKGIKRRIDINQPSIGKWVSIAAMVIIIIGSALLLYNRSILPDRSVKISYEETVNQDNTQLKEMEVYYNSLANSLYREATPLLTANPEIEKEFTSDISQLDSICSEIKRDLKDNVANQEVVEALIQNYRIKIRLLEDMLEVLKENDDNQDKNNGYEL